MGWSLFLLSNFLSLVCLFVSFWDWMNDCIAGIELYCLTFRARSAQKWLGSLAKAWALYDLPGSCSNFLI